MDVTFKGSVKSFLRCQILNHKEEQLRKAKMGGREGCPYPGGRGGRLLPRAPEVPPPN